MNLKEEYEKTLEKLKAGQRPLLDYPATELNELEKHFEKAIEEEDHLTLKMVLCLLDHMKRGNQQFEKALMKCLQREGKESDIIIYSLNASVKHIIGVYQLAGNKLPLDYMTTLKNLLYSKNYEIVEWALRTLDETGNRGRILKDDLKKIRPSKLTFNRHKLEVIKLINYIEGKWGRHV